MAVAALITMKILAMSSSNKRRRPDQRSSNPPPMRLGDNDCRIVRWVYDYRLLSQRQIERLLGLARPTAQRLLRRLYDHRYLDRVFPPVATSGAISPLYILDKRGIQLLQQAGVSDFTAVPGKRLSALFLEHALAINNFRIAFSQGCEARGWTVGHWLTENEIKADYDRVQVPGKKRPVALVPDGFFSVEVPNKGTTFFFLELDRGTMTLARFRDKVATYVAYYKSGQYQRRYHARGFRVLTVVDGSGGRRANNLVRVSGQVPATGRRFWFTLLSRVKPETVLDSPIWYVIGDREPARLFDSS